ncbi:MAG: DALR domain-containing protein, partial [Bacteroidota bacterium]|nr:DALR domain-containing protein [Bacteroidota bacterium]
DFNTPKLIAEIFKIIKLINKVHDEKESINSEKIKLLKNIFPVFISEILGLKIYKDNLIDNSELLNIIIDIRNEVRKNKDYKTSDLIRDKLSKTGYNIKDND